MTFRGATYSIGQEYTEKRNRAIGIAVHLFGLLFIFWAAQTLLVTEGGPIEAVQESFAILVGAILNFSIGIAAIISLVVMLITKRYLRSIVIMGSLMLLQVVPQLAFTSAGVGEWATSGSIVFSLILIQVAGLRGAVVPLLFLPIMVVMWVLFGEVVVFEDVFYSEDRHLFPVTDTIIGIWFFFVSLFLALTRDKKEIKQKNKDLLEATQEMKQIAEQRKKESQRITEKNHELMKVQELLQGRENTIAKLRKELNDAS